MELKLIPTFRINWQILSQCQLWPKRKKIFAMLNAQTWSLLHNLISAQEKVKYECFANLLSPSARVWSSLSRSLSPLCVRDIVKCCAFVT